MTLIDNIIDDLIRTQKRELRVIIASVCIAAGVYLFAKSIVVKGDKAPFKYGKFVLAILLGIVATLYLFA